MCERPSRSAKKTEICKHQGNFFPRSFDFRFQTISKEKVNQKFSLAVLNISYFNNVNFLSLTNNCQVQSIYDTYCQYGSDYFAESYLAKTKHTSWSFSVHGLIEHYSVHDFKKIERPVAPGRALLSGENGSVTYQIQWLYFMLHSSVTCNRQHCILIHGNIIFLGIRGVRKKGYKLSRDVSTTPPPSPLPSHSLPIWLHQTEIVHKDGK